MSTHDRKRQPAGISTGGQFVTQARAESDVTLTPSPKQWRADTVEQAFAETQRHGTGVNRPRVMPKESLAALRADLKTMFGHKFSVRMGTGTAYGWGSVIWDDGPLDETVMGVTNGYCNQQFNGMTDSYDRVNEDSPVEYTLSGVNTHRSIGAVGQAYIDSVFDAAGLDGYTRHDPRTGERDTYSGYDHTRALSDEDIRRVEKALGSPVPQHRMYGNPTASDMAGLIHRYTEFDRDGKATTDFKW